MPAAEADGIRAPPVSSSTHRPVSSERLEEVVFGVLDGVITSLALVVGVDGVLSNTVGDITSRFVFLAILAATLGGMLSMFVGAWLSARSRRKVIRRERAREEQHVAELPEREREELRGTFRRQGFAEPEVELLVRAVTADTKRWVDVMMRDELKLPVETEPQPVTHGAVIGLAYVIGGILPAAPFLVSENLRPDLWASLAIGGIQLAAVGFLEARYGGSSVWRGAAEVVAIGLAAAFAVYLVTTFLQGLPG
jgi:VIT1/CCC1 family predicted Fe2+/Mn2+ transporter